ncbi:phosphatase PAP2 family protein [Nocardia sp. NPDC005366]|uniref:phosphatase PAP2 family protein n=1 Tax=Nocardia sp. NPDC005366 TaxID=3156878 RepID=UPI0033ADD1A6
MSARRRVFETAESTTSPGCRVNGRRSPRTAGLAAVALAATAIAAWTAHTTVLTGLDSTLFHAVNTLPDDLFRPLWLLQLSGVLGAPALVAIVALLLGRYRLASGLVLLIPAKLILERDVLKALVHRPRPAVTMSDPVLRDVPTAGLSFPSGHAVILFGTATLLAPYLSRAARTAVFVFASLAATARVYLGAHAPLDVIGGAAAGVLLGATLTLVVGVSEHRTASSGAHRLGFPSRTIHVSRFPRPTRSSSHPRSTKR